MGDALPDVLPIFPLPGVLLLPRADLPLHIFEPRYRAMTRDALKSDGVIGMIQPVNPAAEGAQPPVYPTGCAGRITECRQTEDGRYHMTLSGVARFRIREELPLLDGYRRVHAEYFAADQDTPPDGRIERERLIQALMAYCEANGFSANWDAIRATPDERLVSGLSMLCPFEPSEKQAILEADDIEARAKLVVALLEMALLARGNDAPLKH
jgi:uncharacterized protein